MKRKIPRLAEFGGNGLIPVREIAPGQQKNAMYQNSPVAPPPN